MKPIIISEGLRMFTRNIRVKFSGIEKYNGNDEEICKKIVEDAYNKEKKHYQVSVQNYPEFYSRDFGWIIQSLINLGHKKRVVDTLKYALKIYENNDGITVAISPSEKPFDFPDIYSPDSVTYLFRSLRIAESKPLILKYKDFLNQEIKRFEDTVIDKTKGIVVMKNFSGMRDYAIRESSCYDMIMACMLDQEIDKINVLMKKEVLRNHLKKYSLKNNLIKYYWTGSYFKDALHDNELSGHCNVYPYWLEIITDKKMLESSIKEIEKRRLHEPFPLKYGNIEKKFLWHEFFVKGWEKESVWGMLGMAYIDIVSRIDKKKALSYLEQYKKKVLENNGFIEVYDHKGIYYRSAFYTTDSSMSWAANLCSNSLATSS